MSVIYMMTFWVHVSCNIEGTNQCFGATYCLHIQGGSETSNVNVCDANSGQTVTAVRWWGLSKWKT